MNTHKNNHTNTSKTESYSPKTQKEVTHKSRPDLPCGFLLGDISSLATTSPGNSEKFKSFPGFSNQNFLGNFSKASFSFTPKPKSKV